MEFPRLVYKSAESYVVAKDEDEHAAMLADGWHASVPEALDARNAPMPANIASVVAARDIIDAHPVPAEDRQLALDADDAAPTRAELEQKAAELGVEFSPKIGDAKMAKRIVDAIAAKD